MGDERNSCVYGSGEDRGEGFVLLLLAEGGEVKLGEPVCERLQCAQYLCMAGEEGEGGEGGREGKERREEEGEGK